MKASEKLRQLDGRVKQLEKRPKKGLSFSKAGLLITYLCVMTIVAVCAILAFQQGDSGTFITVIGGGAIATLGTYIAFFIAKSKAENVKGGISYDTAIMELQHQYEEEGED